MEGLASWGIGDMTQSTPAWIVLAHLLRPQGRKGEVLAELLTDFPERFDGQKRVFLAAPGFAGEEAEARPAVVGAFWLPVGKNGGRVVLQFAGIDTISDAESIAGQDVLVPRGERLVVLIDGLDEYDPPPGPPARDLGPRSGATYHYPARPRRLGACVRGNAGRAARGLGLF